MRNVLFSSCLRVFVCLCVLCGVAVCLMGCARAGAGETAAEVQRKRINVMDNDKLLLQDDIDMIFMLDKPSKLSDRHIR